MNTVAKFIMQVLKEEFDKQELVANAERVLNAYRDRLQKKGINVDSLRQLGVGTMGVAYDMGNKVLKITTDIKEAKASSLVMGKTIPNIIQVYDIWKFPGVNWYGLIIEKLTPLSSEEEKQLTDAVVNTGFPMFLYKSGDDWNKAMQLLAQVSMKKFYSAAYSKFPDAALTRNGQGSRDPRVQEYVKNAVNKTIEEFNRITKEYKMQSLFKSLKSLGIQYYDFHGGNYGRRSDGTLVLFDLGRSISKGTNPVELTEKFKLLEQRFGTIKPFIALQ